MLRVPLALLKHHRCAVFLMPFDTRDLSENGCAALSTAAKDLQLTLTTHIQVSEQACPSDGKCRGSEEALSI